MSACNFVNFDLFIQGEAAPYAVTASYAGQHAVGQLTANMDDATWRIAHLTLEESINFADQSGVAAVGKQLWHALFRADIRDLWIAARTDWERGRVEGIRLRFDIQPVPVAALAWEALRDDDHNLTFAADPDFALVRVASLHRYFGPKRRQQVDLPLRILIAAPEDASGQIDANREIAGIRESIGNYSDRVVQIEELRGRFDVTELSARIAQFRPTLLHFIGHGKPDGLWMWQRGHEWLVAASSLRALITRTRSVKLAVLNTCLAAQPAGPHPFAGVAAQMLQAGLPAVVAMQYRVRDHAAIDFAHFLYDELICGPCPGLIDIAVNRARNSLYTLNAGDFSFGAPILWLNSQKGRIFTLSTEAEAAATTPVVQPPPLPEVQLDLVEERAWLEAIAAQTQVDQLPPNFAFLRTKWNNLIQELRRLLVQIEALAQMPDTPTYPAKVAEYRRFKAALVRVKRLIEEAAASA
jgi:hypothetical protein